MKYLQTSIGRLESETSILLGKHTSGAWTPQTKDHYQLYQSAMTVAQTNLRETCGLVRVGKASATLRPLGNNMSSILLWWLPERASGISECVADGTRINLRLMIGPMWARACFIQFVICPQEEAESFAKPTAEQSEDNAPPIPDGAADVGVLDTIVEEDPDDADDYLSYLQHDDPAMNKYVREAMKHIMEEDNDEVLDLEKTQTHATHGMCPAPMSGSSRADYIREMYHVTAANLRAGLPLNTKAADYGDWVEIEYPAPYHKLIAEELHIAEGETVVLRIYLSSARKKAVVERDTDDLTKEETLKHWEEVAAAMLLELQTWAKYQCFSRKPRASARNIIDSR